MLGLGPCYSYVLCFFPWSYILNILAFSAVLLIFSVLPSTYSVIYCENMPSIWASFSHVFQVFQGPFFCLPPITNRCAGVNVVVLR